MNGQKEFIKGLKLLDCTALVIGSMIGSGIFIVSANIANDVKSPIMTLLVWAVAGGITIAAALSYGELAAAMPWAGGQYIFLREAFGPLWGFLYGWTLFLVIQTGTIAAVAVAFGKFLNVFFPFISLDPRWYPLRILGLHSLFPISTGQLVAIASIFFLSFTNCLGIKTGAFVQNLFTILKVIGLLGLIAVIFTSPKGSAEHLWQFCPEGMDTSVFGFLSIFGGAMVGALFALDAWNNVTFAAAEVVKPQKNLPLALFLGTLTVTLIYLLTNVAYFYLMPWEEVAKVAEIAREAKTATVATEAAKLAAGPIGAKLFTLTILISVFGCLNGLILAGARVYYAMANDGLFFPSLASLHPRYNTPTTALIVQGLWASILTLSGTYSQLLDYIIFAVMIFYVLTVYGLFVLRKTRPDLKRPYKAFAYPILPALYIGIASLISIDLLWVRPAYTWPGLIIVILGIPAYALLKKRG